MFFLDDATVYIKEESATITITMYVLQNPQAIHEVPSISSESAVSAQKITGPTFLRETNSNHYITSVLAQLHWELK
jgi:hypothetical protein